MQLISENSDKISSQLSTLGKNIAIIQTNPKEIDCSNLKWIAPISILPLAALMASKGINTSCENQYLKTINFPIGINDPDSLPRGRTFIPLVKFSPKSPLIEILTTRFIELVLENVWFGDYIKNAFYYAMDEMINNVCEHSATSSGWLLAQYFKTKEFLDVVIVDQGLGIRGAYERALGQEMTDEVGLQRALSGVSIKNDWERGFGLRTTKNLLVNSELNGNFIIISGTKGFFANRENEIFFPLENWSWEGTIIIMRLNKVKKPIELIHYVE